MKFSENYLNACKKDVHDLSKIHKRYWEEPRYQILKKFCNNCNNILSVGCGPKEPILINSSHAIDIIPDSLDHLRKAGWQGTFRSGSCTDIPYRNKEFEIVVCSEVIEHLPDIKDVIKTFHEVARVGKRWIIDTPNSDIIPPKNQNPAHLQFFTINKIEELIANEIKLKCKIYGNDHHIYIESS